MTIGLGGFVFLILLVLKLAAIGSVATWSWWWVTCPLWIGVALWLFVIAVFGLVAGAFGIVMKAKR